MADSKAQPQDRAEHLERKLALPVIAAALVSVPAVFLTTLDGAAAQVGTVLNWMSLAVLTGEAVVLFLVSRDRIRWLRQHRVTVIIAIATVPAVVFAVGPVQLLRLVRFVGALRVIRVNRILKAGRILRTRADLEGVWRNAVAIGITLVAAAFVALVLADQTSHSRQWLEGLTQRFGVAPVLLAGVILGAATFVVLRNRTAQNDQDPDQQEDPDDL